MARIIVEGMDHDNTRINYVASEADITPNVGHIRVAWGDYRLPLKRTVPKELSRGTLEETLQATPIGLFERVEIVLVEHPDGIRVYSDAMKHRFDFVMKDIFETAGSFDESYRQITADPGKFYSGAVKITQGEEGPVIELLGGR